MKYLRYTLMLLALIVGGLVWVGILLLDCVVLMILDGAGNLIRGRNK